MKVGVHVSTESLCAFWTEHEGNGAAPCTTDAPPTSAELSSLTPGRILIGCSPWAIFVLRGVYTTYEEAKAAQNEMHTLGWDAWLAAWKLWLPC